MTPEGCRDAKYKMTEIGEIPVDWAPLVMGDVCEFTQGIQIPRDQLTREKKIGYTRYLYIRDFTTDAHKWYVVDDYPNKGIDEDTIVMANTGAAGKVFQGKAGVLSNNAFKITFDKKVISTEFMFQYLKSPLIQGHIERLFNHAGQPHVGHKNIAQLPLALSPLPEQKKIAEILGSVDEAIRTTQAVIDQTRKVKQGLLQKLLTRGIGHTRFKKTEIGEIPVGWEVVELNSILADVKYPMRSGPFGSALLKSELVSDGAPFLGIDNVHVEHFNGRYTRFVTEEKFQELKRYAVHERDVMITIMGTVGRCCVVPSGTSKALSSKHVWTMTFDTQAYLPELICLQLNYAPWVLSEFHRVSQGGVMAAISSSTLRSLRLPCPPIEEQHQIAGIMENTSDGIKRLETEKLQLQELKKGLMQDLLTGRVRVTKTV